MALWNIFYLWILESRRTVFFRPFSNTWSFRDNSISYTPDPRVEQSAEMQNKKNTWAKKPLKYFLSLFFNSYNERKWLFTRAESVTVGRRDLDTTTMEIWTIFRMHNQRICRKGFVSLWYGGGFEAKPLVNCHWTGHSIDNWNQYSILLVCRTITTSYSTTIVSFRHFLEISHFCLAKQDLAFQ